MARIAAAMIDDADEADDLGVALGDGLHFVPPDGVVVVVVVAGGAAPLTAWRSCPRLDAASDPADVDEDDDDEEGEPFDEPAFGSGRPGSVTFCSGAGSGGLPNGPEPAGGLLGS